MAKDNVEDNDVVIGLAVFCVKCMDAVRPATYKDMNGEPIECKKCGEHSNSAVGISVMSNSHRMLHEAYDQMAKHKKTVNALLSERIQPEDV
jgi:hypothetical protein